MAPTLPAPELTARQIRDSCDYLTIPSAVAAEPDLSPGAKLAYGWLLRFGDMRKGIACPSHAALGQKIGVRERQVQRYIHELVRRDLIAVVPRPRLANQYVFLKHPLLTEKPRRRGGRT